MSTAHTAALVPQASQAGIWIHDPASTDPEVWQGLLNKVEARLYGLQRLAPVHSLESDWAAWLDAESQPEQIPAVDEVLGLGQLWRTVWGGAVFVCYPQQKARSTRLGFATFAQPSMCAHYFDAQRQFQLPAPPPTTSLSESSGLTFTAVTPVEPVQALQTAGATAPLRDTVAEAKFRSVFEQGAEEKFEDGMESEFSRELESLVKAYGAASKPILARLLEDASISPAVWAEALRCLGRLDDPASREARLWVLEKGLTSPFLIIRDGAALGLASMDDPSAIPYLQLAVDSERVPELRTDMEQVLSQLASHE